MKFKKGDRVYQKCPAVSSAEGVVGYTRVYMRVVAEPFRHRRRWWVPVVWAPNGVNPFLVPRSSVYPAGKKANA